MPDPTTIELLRGLVLSANELKSLTDWPDALIEDYLNIVDNLITIANLLDIEIDQKIEEIPTDFIDGSIPFIEDNLLIEDNTNLFWDSLNNILNVLNIILGSATASRLLSTDGDKVFESVVALTSWIAGTANQILITDDGDGTVTISIPDPFNVPGDLVFVGASKGLGYGSLYLHEATVNIDITGAGVDTYVKITGLTTGLLNNVTINSDAFNADNTGVYKVDWQISADSQGNNLVYECDIFVNGVEQDDGSSRRKFGAAADYGSFSGTALLDITDTSHDIDLRLKQVGGVAADIDIFNLNFNIVQIGGT